MNTTKEIRWFFSDENEKIKDWFDQLTFDTLSKRTDFYLDLSNKEVGIKLRENFIEIKTLQGTRAKGCLNENAWGYFECWEKWSFKADDKDGVLQSVTHGKSPKWIPVEKERLAVQLVQSNGTWKAHPLSNEIERASQLEYTRITIAELSYFTFGLEWPGDTCCAVDSVFFDEIFGKTKMTLGDSMGYPEFLVEYENLKSLDMHTIP